MSNQGIPDQALPGSGATAPDFIGGVPSAMVQALYAVGFRGDALSRMVAIGMRESGGTPSAHNGNASTGDDSWGWFQINYLGSLSASRTAAFGTPQNLISSPDNQAKAAWSLSNGGTNFQPWTTNAGLSQANLTAASAAISQLSQSGQITDAPAYAQSQAAGLGASGAGADPSATGGGTTPDVSGTAAGNGNLYIPKDGAVFNVTGQAPVIVYDLGNGLKVYFDFSAPGTNVQALMGQQYVLGSGMAPNISAQDFYANNGPGWSPTTTMIHGGTVQALAGLASLQSSGGSFDTWMKTQLNTVSGGRADWQADPQIAGLLVQRVLGTIDDATLQVDIQQTNFWKTHTTQETSWENLSPADQAQKVASEVSNLQAINSNWGIPAGDLTAAATNIANGTSTEDQYTQTLQKQATVMYPWMADFAKQNIDTKTAAAPWLSTYANTMEKPADLMNAQVQKALTSGTPVYQFEQDLKNSPDWLQTKNAAQDLSTNAASIGRLMGFS